MPGAPGSFYVSELTPFEGKLYFSGETSIVSTGLWVSDGTVAGTQELQVPGVSSFGLMPRSMVSIGSKLVLDGTSASNAEGLWVSDGTAAGAVALSVPGLNPSGHIAEGPAGLFAFGNKAAFAAMDASGQDGLWVTDGTVAGTLELPGVHVSSWGAPMAALPGSRLAFIATDSAGAKAVWVTDGTAIGTKELHPSGASASYNPNGVMAVDGHLLFDGLDGSGVNRLWTSDGTSAGTTPLQASAVTLQDNYTSISAEMPGPSQNFAWTDTTTGAVSGATGSAYTGPVSYLNWQMLWSGTDAVNLRANGGNAFLRGGPGSDALQATAGSNVLDGGTGSNFLVGASGIDGGADTFFIDARSSNTTWSTLTNFHPGDAVTVWGFLGGVSALSWAALDGAAGYQGATIHAETGGAGTGVNGSVTFAGIDPATVQSKFAVSTGHAGVLDYLYVKYAG